MTTHEQWPADRFARGLQAPTDSEHIFVGQVTQVDLRAGADPLKARWPVSYTSNPADACNSIWYSGLSLLHFLMSPSPLQVHTVPGYVWRGMVRLFALPAWTKLI